MENKKYIIEMPNMRHANKENWDYVYEPAEDTFLLLDALEKDMEYIYLKKPAVVLEIGSGSGTVITALSKILKTSSHHVAIDINRYACNLTKQTSFQNNSMIDVIQGDLTTCIKQQSVDLILFNPPYVVTPTEEVYSTDPLTKSWAGGSDGTVIINDFIEICYEALSKKGFGYLLIIKENKPDVIIRKLEEKLFFCEIILTRKIRSEELFVLKFIKI